MTTSSTQWAWIIRCGAVIGTLQWRRGMYSTCKVDTPSQPADVSLFIGVQLPSLLRVQEFIAATSSAHVNQVTERPISSICANEPGVPTEHHIPTQRRRSRVCSPFCCPLHRVVCNHQWCAPVQNLVSGATEGIEDGGIPDASKWVLSILCESVVDDAFLGH